jgi:hypothetical protein
MKKVLVTLLTVIVVLGLFAAAGYAGYRFGYMRGAQITANAGTPNGVPNPGVRPFDNFDRREMPMHNFGDNFGRSPRHGFGMRGFPMMGIGFGFFSPLIFLGRIFVFALILWFIYWLFTRSGWRLTRTVPVTETPSKPAETEVEVKEE